MLQGPNDMAQNGVSEFIMLQLMSVFPFLDPSLGLHSASAYDIENVDLLACLESRTIDVCFLLPLIYTKYHYISIQTHICTQ